MPQNSLTRRFHPVALLWVALLSGLAAAQPVSPAELRREIENLQAENQLLATQVQDLTTRLADAEAQRELALHRIRDLETDLERLRQGGGRAEGQNQGQDSSTQAPGSPPPAAPTRAAVPEDPMASPASLLAELQRRYRSEVAGSEIADPATPGPPAAPPFTAELRKSIDTWCIAQARSLRGTFEWRVRFTGLRTLGRHDRTVMMTVIDPASGLPIGDTLEVAVPRDFGDRLARELGPTGGDDKAPLWTLAGSMGATPKVNPDRPTPGVFNHPAFIGPYVEFAFNLDWQTASVIPATGPATAAPPTP